MKSELHQDLDFSMLCYLELKLIHVKFHYNMCKTYNDLLSGET